MTSASRFLYYPYNKYVRLFLSSIIKVNAQQHCACRRGYMGRVLKCFVMDDHDSISGRLILPSQDMPHLICDSSMLPK
uniref:Uncharacterized protein n=1 Tax=Parascaris univalens TaxID=6257 RepID=A0A914ZSP1_PARUN